MSQEISVSEGGGNFDVCLSVELIGVFESDLTVHLATTTITAS